MTSISVIKAGDILTDFLFWECIPRKAKRAIRCDCDGELYLNCNAGRHYLDGQTDDDNNLVGCRLLKLAVKSAEA